GAGSVSRIDSPPARTLRSPLSLHDALPIYPLTPYLKAFEFAVCSAGYNSVHENLAVGLAAVYVPNTAAVTDNQSARAEHRLPLRSEEHTSELQSRFELVCRLLLE